MSIDSRFACGAAEVFGFEVGEEEGVALRCRALGRAGGPEGVIECCNFFNMDRLAIGKTMKMPHWGNSFGTWG